MKKTKSGIIAILANYGSPEMRKVLDVKITSGFPTVTIPKGFKVVLPQTKQTLRNYQHITIPPDLNIHITGNSQPKVWNDGFGGLLTRKGTLKKSYQKLLTVVFPPISDFPVFTNRQYVGVMIIALPKMPHWTENTGFVLELFAQNKRNITIPKKEHYSGEKGAYESWKYSSVGKTYNEDYKKGNFYIRQFAITNHDPKPERTVIVYFGAI